MGSVGLDVGIGEGSFVGALEGEEDVDAVGFDVGVDVGLLVSFEVGEYVTITWVGLDVGLLVGTLVGTFVGLLEGPDVQHTSPGYPLPAL